MKAGAWEEHPNLGAALSGTGKGPHSQAGHGETGHCCATELRVEFFGLGLFFGFFPCVLTLQPGFALRGFVFS